MSKLKINREKLNLTQEELSDNSGISVRTIQRIESGIEPKGQTLKRLAKTLGINENELLRNEPLVNEPLENEPLENRLVGNGLVENGLVEKEGSEINFDTTIFKIINISSLPFAIFPPANIVVPLIIMLAKQQFNPLAKKIISIQILWLIIAFIVFMLSAFSRKWFSLGRNFMLIIIILLVLTNVAIILRNSIEIDKKGKLFFSPNFNLI